MQSYSYILFCLVSFAQNVFEINHCCCIYSIFLFKLLNMISEYSTYCLSIHLYVSGCLVFSILVLLQIKLFEHSLQTLCGHRFSLLLSKHLSLTYMEIYVYIYRKLKNCFPKLLQCLTFQQQCGRVPVAPHPFQHLILSIFSNLNILVDLGSLPVSGRSPVERNGNPLQYSCLENSMDREAQQPPIHGVVKSRT